LLLCDDNQYFKSKCDCFVEVLYSCPIFDKTLNITLQNINWTKKSGILIIEICLIGLFIKYAVEPFREGRIYNYGNWLFLILFYDGIFGSVVSTILLISKHKFDFKII